MGCKRWSLASGQSNRGATYRSEFRTIGRGATTSCTYVSVTQHDAGSSHSICAPSSCRWDDAMCKYADKRRSRAVWSSGRLILMLLRTSLGVESAPYFLFTMSLRTNIDALSYASRISKVRVSLPLRVRLILLGLENTGPHPKVSQLSAGRVGICLTIEELSGAPV